jgi:hypothetical protein
MYATANMGHPSRTIGFGLSKNTCGMVTVIVPICKRP